MNFWDEFSKTVWRYQNKEALIIYKKGRRESITYSELKEEAIKISNALLERGLKKGDRCVLLAQTSILWAKLALAVARIGALLIPIDPLLSKEETEEILSQALPRLAIVEDEFEEKIKEDLADCIITLKESKKHLTLSQILTPTTKEIKPPYIQGKDPLVVPYTSGTTGNPKGAILTHQGFLEVTSPAAIQRLKLTSEEIIVSLAPWHHVMGYFALLTSLLLGAKLIYTNDFRQILSILSKEKATILLAPPKLFNVMLERMRRQVYQKGFLARLLWQVYPKKIGQKFKEKYGLQNLRFFVAGSAKSDPQVVKGFRKLGIGYVEGYGMSENCSLSHLSSPFNKKPGSVGPLIPGMEQMIVKVKKEDEEWIPIFDENGNPVRAKVGEYGELWLKGPNIMEGYLRRPDLTTKVLWKGWLRTGDSAMLDKDGWLWIRGRIDEVIVTSEGKNVSKVEVEQVLLRSPLVEEVIVYYAEGKIKAKIYPDFEKICGRKLSSNEAAKYIQENKERLIDLLWKDLEKRQKLAPFKRIAKRNIEIVPQAFEKTSTQKIKRYRYEM